MRFSSQVYEADFKAEWKAYKEAVSKYKEQLTPSQLMGMEKEARQRRLKKKALVKRRVSITETLPGRRVSMAESPGQFPCVRPRLGQTFQRDGHV